MDLTPNSRAEFYIGFVKPNQFCKIVWLSSAINPKSPISENRISVVPQLKGQLKVTILKTSILFLNLRPSQEIFNNSLRG